jgi:hypothetical protein
MVPVLRALHGFAVLSSKHANAFLARLRPALPKSCAAEELRRTKKSCK